ncbi:MAG: hypothetical protein QM528_04165 [Phycisphaerales bacterium]|nr:hypothetical protein [Phycisphaerales bacterium]
MGNLSQFHIDYLEHITGIPSEEGRCKTRRTKCPSKMGEGKYTKKASGSNTTIVKKQSG